MTAPLSPAQKIVAAFNERHELCGPFDDNWVEQCLAAALCAAADQVVPDEDGPSCEGDEYQEAYELRKFIRHDFLTIATELETTP